MHDTTPSLPESIKLAVAPDGDCNRDHDIFSHRFNDRSVGTHWWRVELDRWGLVDEMFSLTDGYLSRADVFRLGDALAVSGADADARRLLWASCAWGTDSRQRGNRKRIESVAGDLVGASELLIEAAKRVSTRCQGGLSALRPRGTPAITHLGPAFFTKFLYFAGGGRPDHPSAILDERVATRLAQESGWTEFPTRGWSSDQYKRYTDALQHWARELSHVDRDVAPDQIERWLFGR